MAERRYVEEAVLRELVAVVINLLVYRFISARHVRHRSRAMPWAPRQKLLALAPAHSTSLAVVGGLGVEFRQWVAGRSLHTTERLPASLPFRCTRARCARREWNPDPSEAAHPSCSRQGYRWRTRPPWGPGHQPCAAE